MVAMKILRVYKTRVHCLLAGDQRPPLSENAPFESPCIFKPEIEFCEQFLTKSCISRARSEHDVS